jgi:surface antigen
MANGGGYGHVAVVESVNSGVSVRVTEMNAYRCGGGFNRISTCDISWSEATSGMYNYIH